MGRSADASKTAKAVKPQKAASKITKATKDTKTTKVTKVTKDTKGVKKTSAGDSSEKSKPDTNAKPSVKGKVAKKPPAATLKEAKGKGKDKLASKGPSKKPAPTVKIPKASALVQSPGKTAKPNAVVAKPERGQWACLTCTYFNSEAFYSCEMCFTPRAFSVQAVSDSGKPDVHLEFQEGNSSKFWSLKINGCTTIITYGRIGTSGQTDTKIHANEATARKFAAKIQAEKEKKGYRNAFEDL
jgi:predicted DNA-binding WGR domain protein